MPPTPAHLIRLGLLLLLPGLPVRSAPSDTAPPSGGATAYTATLKPLLRDRCFSCHGALQQKAGLRLDSVELLRRGGKSGPAIDPARPADSLLLRRVATADLADRMPPEHEGEPFSPTQLDLLRQWLAAGAPAPAGDQPESDPREHWAFQPRVRPFPPATPNPGWTRNPIDAFIAIQHREQGLQPVPEAPRHVLVRRLFLDLVGLPPSAAEFEALLADPARDWYERAVDRLLDDPRHGERWARHWMDIWRYSDAWGLGDQHRNSQRHIWHWRDWIVDSLNADLPYDEMIRLMLAADESHPADLARLRATGFLARNYFLFNRNQWLDETVEHVSKGFLGLTMNCAKCHDHKYDPFPQVDYYRLRAFFEPYHARLDLLPGESDPNRDALPRAFDRQLDVPTYRFVRGNENAPDKSAPIPPGIPALLALRPLDIRPVPLPPEASQPERRPWVFEAYLATARARLESARQKRDELEAHTTADPGPSPSHAAPDLAAQREVAQLTVAVAEAEVHGVEQRARAHRASWASDTQTTTTTTDTARIDAVRAERALALAKARLAVAEVVLRHLRAPTDKKDAVAKELATAREKLDQAARSSETAPSPEDPFTPLPGAFWTATRFLDSTKDDPAVDFPTASSGRRSALAAWITDPRHPLTARVAVNHLWNRHLGTPLVPSVFDFGRKSGPPTHPELVDWLASELVDHGWSLKHLHRLIVLSATYRMGSSLAGAEANLARDPDNRFWWRRTPVRLEAQVVRDAVLAHAGTLDPSLGGPPVPPAQQDSSRRRSLYFYHSNNDRNLFLATFDDALVKECYRREQSIVPQQALALLNGRLVHEHAAPIADRLADPAAPGDDAFIRRAFNVLLGFPPTPDELAAARDALTHPAASPASDAPPTRPRANLVWALLNHTDFVTLR